MCQYYTKKTDRKPYEKFADGSETCIEDEIPFDLPQCWAWARLKNLSESIQYGYNAPAKVAGRIRMVRITDIQNNGILWGQVPYCDIENADIPKYLLHAGDLLFARTGGTVGKSYLVSEVPDAAVYAGYLIRTRCTESLSPQYAKRFMESAFYWMQLRKDVIATAQPNCNGQKLGDMLIPLPPLAEQKRIVAKIEELFAEVEKIATAKDGITRTAERINKKVLDLAIRGQLVPQDASDEPAAELLKRIAEARQKATSGRSRVSGKDSGSIIFRGADRSAYETRNGKTVCIDDEIPFEIPDSWAWARLESVVQFLSGNTPSKDLFAKHGIPYFKVAEMNLPGNEKYLFYTELHIHPSASVKVFPSNTIVFPKNGGAMLTNKKRILVQESVCDLNTGGLFPHVADVCEYLFAWFASIDLSKYVKGGVIPTTDVDRLRNTLIPLPPLAEQKRIVARIEEVRKLTQSLTK